MAEQYDLFPSMNLNECDSPIERKSFTFRYHKIGIAEIQGLGQEEPYSSFETNGKVVAKTNGLSIRIPKGRTSV